MRRPVTSRTAALAALAACASLAPRLRADDARAPREVDDPTRVVTSVDVETLKKSPGQFVDVNVRFKAMFHGLENLWAPFFTPFLPEDYMVFSVWPPDAEVWTREGRLRDLPTCFMAKDDAQLATLLGLKPYTPVEVTGVVRSAFHDLPWVEVRAIRALGKPMFTDEEIRRRITGEKAPAAVPAPAPAAPEAGPAPAAPEAQPAQPAAPQSQAPDLGPRVAELEAALAAKDKEVEQLKAAAAGAGNAPAPAAVPEAVEKAVAERDQARAAAEQLKAEAEGLRKALREAEAAGKGAAEGDAALKAAQKSVEDLNTRVATLSQQVEGLTQENAHLKEQGGKATGDAATEIEKRDALLKKAEQEQADLNGKLQEAQKQVEAARAEAEKGRTAAAETAALKEDLAKAKAEAEAARKQAADLQGQSQAQAERAQALEKQVSGVNAQMAEARQALAEAEKSRQQSSQSQASLEKQNSDLKSQVTYLEGFLRKFVEKADAASEKLKEPEGAAKPPAPPAAPEPKPEAAPAPKPEAATAPPAPPAAGDDDKRLLELIEQIEKGNNPK